VGVGELVRQRGELFAPGFELFADVLSLGLATTAASLALVTVPAALSTACGQLRRRAVDGTPAGAGRYFPQLARRMRGPRGRGDILAGVVAVLVGAVVVLDLALAGAGLPGAGAVTTALLISTAVLVTIALRAVAMPESERGWRVAFRAAARASVSDPAGSALLLIALGTAVVCSWVLLPVAVLIPGPLALAATAVEIRRGAARR
jgi:lysylphosphatidylglycerol synthetase-like protein (DUF2156 family)